MASVRLTNVKKVYDKKVVAVEDFNLNIEDKEFVVFVGPSGCGKSTTLRMIAGLEEITEGTIEIDNEVVNDLQPRDRDIAMVFQNYALYPHLSVFENMAFSLRLRKMKQEEVYQRVTDAAATLGITDLLLRKPRALSGGQRQRVAIGRAMVRDSKVLLMDEPLSNLDAKLRNQMRAELIMLRQKINTTFIYVTHDQTEAMTLGDRIVVMKDGFIQQVGSPQYIYNHPYNKFVAGFIGTPQMNFYNARLNGKMLELDCGARIELTQSKLDAIDMGRITSNGAVVVGIRPESFYLGGDNGLDAEIDIVERLGSELIVYATVGQAQEGVIAKSNLVAKIEPFTHIERGDRVSMAFDIDKLQLFDMQTELSLDKDANSGQINEHN